MQLLDENHLLLKYTSEDVVVLKTTDTNSQPSLFVVYNIVSTEVSTQTVTNLDIFVKFVVVNFPCMLYLGNCSV